MDCDKCAPKLQAENIIPAKIYQLVRNQHVFGPRGPVDIKHDALWEWIDRMEVHEEDKELCFKLVYAAYKAYIEAAREKQEVESVQV